MYVVNENPKKTVGHYNVSTAEKGDKSSDYPI
jgi:hypothetical protein